MDYRLYVDESGDHCPCVSDTAQASRRYLGLIGVAIPRGEPYETLCKALERLKRDHLPHDDPDYPPILHRDDIKNARGEFRVLQDTAKRNAFDADLIALLRDAPLWIVSVVIDKFSHGRADYRTLRHPYHYCLLALLQRYCGWLERTGRKRGDLMVESRGKKEDRLFQDAYRELYQQGGLYLSRARAQATLTSKKPKIRPKQMNIAGLQIADILAHPLKLDVLVAAKRLPNRGGEFADRIAAVAVRKYNHHLWWKYIKGYGRVLLK